MSKCLMSMLLVTALAAAGCGGQGGGTGQTATSAAEEPASQPPLGTEGSRGGGQGAATVLAARFGKAPLLLGEVKFKPAGRGELRVEIDNAKPGSSYAVTMDGAALGELRIDLEGEGELTLVGGSYPAGFTGPRAGSVIVVGDLFQGALQPLEKLVDLSAVLDLGGGVVGDAGYKVERLAGARTRELEVDLRGKPERIYAVSLDGVALGELALDEKGKGEIKLSDFDGDPFPAGFVEPREGSLLRIGRFEVRLSGHRGQDGRGPRSEG